MIYLKKYIDPILDPILVKIINEKPKNIVDFIIRKIK